MQMRAGHGSSRSGWLSVDAVSSNEIKSDAYINYDLWHYNVIIKRSDNMMFKADMVSQGEEGIVQGDFIRILSFFFSPSCPALAKVSAYFDHDICHSV